MVKKVGICKRKEYKNENLKKPFMFSFVYSFLLHIPTFLTMHRREIDTLIDYSCKLRIKVWLVQSGITFES